MCVVDGVSSGQCPRDQRGMWVITNSPNTTLPHFKRITRPSGPPQASPSALQPVNHAHADAHTEWAAHSICKLPAINQSSSPSSWSSSSSYESALQTHTRMHATDPDPHWEWIYTSAALVQHALHSLQRNRFCKLGIPSAPTRPQLFTPYRNIDPFVELSPLSCVVVGVLQVFPDFALCVFTCHLACA